MVNLNNKIWNHTQYSDFVCLFVDTLNEGEKEGIFIGYLTSNWESFTLIAIDNVIPIAKHYENRGTLR